MAQGFLDIRFLIRMQQQYRPCDVVLDEDDERFVVVFEETLDVGDGMLRIGFSGILNEHLRVLYRWYSFCVYSVLDKLINKEERFTV